MRGGAPISASQGPMSGLNHLWKSYERQLALRPLITKMATSCIGFSLGDLLAQKLMTPADKPFQWDAPRTLRMATFGTFVQATTGHYWYNFLDRTILPQAAKSTRAIFTKVAADQLGFSPIMNCVFLAGIRVLEGKPDEIQSTVQERWLPMMKANYMLWPLAHTFGFRFVPTEQRILYINCVALIWNCIVSIIANEKSEDIKPTSTTSEANI